MSEIIVIKDPTKETLQQQGVFDWPVWAHEAAVFPWTYDERETCFFLEGDVVVTPENGEPVRMGKGDMVTFPQGMDCTWEIKKAVKKHYSFG